MASRAVPAGSFAREREGSVEFTEVLRRRRMVRNYTDQAVDPAVVERIVAEPLCLFLLEHGRAAPASRAAGHPRLKTP